MSLAADDKVGGRYRLIETIGRGGSGEVWSARDLELDREVAVKLLRIWNDEHKAKVWREARLAGLLDEAVAVPVYDFGDDGQHCFLVMELVCAPTLRKLIDDETLDSSRDVLGLALCLARTLAHVHRSNVVHRDIKPENVFVDLGSAAAGCRLVDFGLAFLTEQTSPGLGRLTSADGLSGTPAYLSPEQARRHEIGPKSDMYSLGCVLYELLCGEAPFQGSAAELLSKHIYLPPIPVREREPGVDPALANLVERLLHKDPDRRPSAAELVDALEALASTQPQPSLAHSRELRAVRQPREERMVPAAVASSAASRVLRVAAAAGLPSWVGPALVETGMVELCSPTEAELAISSLPAKREVEGPTLGVWIEDARPPVAALIRAGHLGLITRDSSTEEIRRLLRKALRRFDREKSDG